MSAWNVYACSDCGMAVTGAEFHPQLYCLLYKAGERNPEAYVKATMPMLVEHFGLSGVPGGGEPQPATSTDNDDEDEPHYEPPCCCGHVWDEHDIRSSACEVPDCDCCYFDADEPVRSAGGGDQPDTPCPECGGSGIKPWDALTTEERTGDLVPCPACTDKETPHGQ